MPKLVRTISTAVALSGLVLSNIALADALESAVKGGILNGIASAFEGVSTGIARFFLPTGPINTHNLNCNNMQ